MTLYDLMYSPWAIEPEKLEAIHEVYLARRSGDKIAKEDLDLIARAHEAATGQAFGKKEQGYEVVDGTAIIPIDGTIAPKANLFSKISGGASVQLIQRDFEQAIADPVVKSIVLEISSPGGSVDGVQELAMQIFEARGRKPITAITGSNMTSAAYWIGAAADQVLISNDTTRVGSIGVYTIHTDTTKAQEKAGVKRTVISAGQFKAVGNDAEPLSDEAKAIIQGQVDYVYSVFVKDVAMFRGEDVETVLGTMAEGRVFIGKQAIEAGLVDGVSTMGRLLSDLSAANKSGGWRPGVSVSAPGSTLAGVPGNESEESEVITMTLEQFKAEHPDVFQAAFDAGVASVEVPNTDTIKAEGHAEGVLAERQRILECQEQTVPGFEAVVQDAIATGKSPAETAMAINKAIRTEGKNVLDDLRDGGSKPVVSVNAPEGGSKPNEGDFLALVASYQAEHGCKRGEAIKAVASEHPEAHKAYIAAINTKK